MLQWTQLFLVVAAIVLLWNQPLLYPVKLLAVFFHEASHGLTALATGGRVVKMVVNAGQGGLLRSAAGNRFLTLNAGYLGSLIWGAMIFSIAVSRRRDRLTMFCLGALIFGITYVYVRNLFGIVFSMAAGTGMMIVAMAGSAFVNDFALRFIGLAVMLYVPLDIWSDVIRRPNIMSDARMLADEFGGTPQVWGIAWLAVSVFVIFHVVRWSLRSDAGMGNPPPSARPRDSRRGRP